MEGVPLEVVRVSLFFKQQLMVVMIDVSMACTVSESPPQTQVFVRFTVLLLMIDSTDSGSFDGARLLWDVPQVVPPLVGEEVGFESRSLSLGVDGLLLDERMAAARGFSVVQQRHLIQMGVPFGAEGGYRKVQSVQTSDKVWKVVQTKAEVCFCL